MTPKNHGLVPDLESDPFGERSMAVASRRFTLLGGSFRFDSNSRDLMRLVDSAYAGLPRHRLSARTPEFRIKLLLTRDGKHRRPARLEPPPFAMLQGAGFLGGATDSSSFVALSPKERAALVVISPRMLHFPYHARYELIEFAVFTLAARAQRLVPLHAACIGHRGRGILLLGESGAGKSTVALHCLLQGLDFLSEDSVFVAANSLRATGVANFLHLRAESLAWLGRSREASAIRNSPVIRRRSGVEKFELDLRRSPFRLARSPLKLDAVVFLTSRSAGAQPLLRSLPKSEFLANLAITQAYGASQPQWRSFSRKASQLDAYELRRGRHPLEAVEVLRQLLMPRRRPR